MNNQDQQQILADIVRKADKGEYTKFEYIRSWKDYKQRKMNCAALDMLIDSLEHSIRSLLNRYCKAVEKGCADITTLLVREKLLTTKAFYERELGMIQDMLSEYEAYLLDSGFISQFLFYEIRPISECWDRRDMDNGF
jgi:archaellum biogenesis protein FlaJ (TadC family)